SGAANQYGKVWGNDGIVITSNNVLFSDVSREFHDQSKNLSIFRYRKIVKPIKKDATVAVLSASGAKIYYHWMMDVIPRINLLIKSGHFDSIDFFITNYTGLSFQKELLKRLNINVDKIIASNDFENFHLQATTLIVPSLVTPNDAPSKEACSFLRQLFEDDLRTNKPEKCIYIQRKSGRKVTNEQELINYLQQKGFEILQAESLTVAQQACVFSEARFVVAPHGAGLTNLVFSQPGCKIIDIFSPEWVNGCYWVLSSQLDLKYAYLIGEGEANTIIGKNTDIVVDMEKFDRLFSMMENE
ncbi:glycosyltransferase family 61 protein, partial [bacterium]